MKRVGKIQILFTVMIIFFIGLTGTALAATEPPSKGNVLPAINLPVPTNPDEKNYLGLSGSGTFKISQIKAKVVIVEIFSMYCPYCQADAPNVNRLYKLINGDSKIKDKITS